MAGSPPKKMCKEQDEEAQNKVCFTPREYQVELLELAKDHNTIACLGTGTGKTFIAVMLIRELAHSVRIPFEEGGKKIIFLVPTVPLVTQQSEVIKQHTDLKVRGYFGEMDVDSWSHEQWQKEFKEYEVLVMTAEICRIIIHHSFLSIPQIKLLIFDECHRAQGNHPYREVMKCFSSCPDKDMPRIFGLSASLLNQKCKPKDLERNIFDLEKTLRCVVETASDISNLRKYGTDPKEYLVFYHQYTNPVQDEITAVIQRALHELKLKTPFKYEEDSMACGEIVYFKLPEKCLKQVLKIFNTLGTWCAHLAATVLIKEINSLLKRLKYVENEAVLKCAKDYLEEFQRKCVERDGCSFSLKKLDALPHKLQRFIEIFFQIEKNSCLLDENAAKAPQCKNGNDNYHSLCGIVFVEQRIIAFILCQFIWEVKKHYPKLEFLHPGFVVGHGTFKGSGNTETSMSVRKQKDVIESFRKKTVNLLIATSVIEEGMDVPRCNVVVRFDLPPDFRSYVQSKGRGRSKNALYILLADFDEKEVVYSNLSNYITIEAMLIKRCHNRIMPSEEEIQEHMDDDLLPPYMPVKAVDSPRITFTSAISVVNRYCAKLPRDMATTLVPKWRIVQVSPEDSPKKEYVCTMRLPINSCFKQDIVGVGMPRVRAAKMAAALKACELLDECGELDDHFVPRNHVVDDALNELLGDLADGIEESKPGKPQHGTKARRQTYEKQVAEVFKNNIPVPGESCYLYVFEMDLIVPLPKEFNPKGRPVVNPADTMLSIGMLSKWKIPPVCKFPIFTRSGVVRVHTKLAASGLIFNQEQLDKLADFHEFVFSDALLLEDNRIFFDPQKAEFSLYIVPVNRDEPSRYFIDWKFMADTKLHEYNVDKWRSPKELRHIEYDELLFWDSVVIRAYKIDWDVEKPSFHYVNRITKLTPLSVLEDSGKNQAVTFEDYYEAKYNLTIKCKSQPLIETERVQSITLWKPSHKQKKWDLDAPVLSKTKQRSLNYREYLVPELCAIHPFRAFFFRKVICIPTILFRLNSLLLGEQLRKRVAESANFGVVNLPGNFEWPYFDLVAFDKILHKSENFEQYISQAYQNPKDIIKSSGTSGSESEIISFQAQPELHSLPGPDPAFILQALTPKSAGDVYNLERLETIGDSFLKYAMSVKIYNRYPNFDEGKLTKIRIGFVRNLYLYLSASKKSLQQYLICEPFTATTSWLPPGYCVNDQKVESVSENDDKANSADIILLQKQVICDKTIADSVEALIGVYLLSCGQLGALHFMRWLGLNAFPPDEKNFSQWPSMPRPPLLVDRPELLPILTSGMDRFEARIGYTFRDKAYLLQAFTHPSDFDNEITDCYQRLEFLGDSVLDYLVTRKLYEDPKQHSPGELTDLRSALVNNAYFASLAISYDFHRHLRMRSPVLFRLIEEYIKMLERTEAFKMFKEHGYYLEEIECFDIEEVEVPKALGDVFESVAGAIYLDSGMSLDAVWEVYFRMMKPAMDHMAEHVPKSPVRELYEALPSNVRFGLPIVEESEKIRIDIRLPCGTVVTGIGPNKHVAKRSCAKRALAFLRQNMLG